MVFNVLLGLLAALGAMVIFSLVALAIGYFWVSHRLRIKIAEVRELECLLAKRSATATSEHHHRSVQHDREWAREHVPPLEIRLVQTSQTPHPLPAGLSGSQLPEISLLSQIDHWLCQHNFECLGSFTIQPLGECLVVYLNDDRTLVGAIREVDRAERTYVEFCFDLGAGERGGVSNPPVDVLPLPDDAIGRFILRRLQEDFSVLSQLWLEAIELAESPEVAARLVKRDPGDIAEFFEEAHRHQMQCRLWAGGISEVELRASFVAQGIEATPRDIAEIQAAWQIAIQDHWLDCSPQARRHSQHGSDVLAVCDHSLSAFLVERMRRFLAARAELDGPAVDSNLQELQELLLLFSPRDALARFRPLLPVAHRYRLVDQIQQPMQIDYYLLPRG